MTSVLLLIISVAIIGCGQNNLLQGLSKPEEHENAIESAQTYLDNGEYDKAISEANSILRNHPDDNDAKAIKGQALLGRAGGGLTDILGKIGENKEVSSNFNALSIISRTKLSDLYAAADTLRGIEDTDQNVRLAEGVACMLSAVAKVTWTFNPVEGKLNTGSGNEPALGTDVKTDWVNASNAMLTYSTAAVAAIVGATGHDDLRGTVASINADIVSINTFITNNPALPVPYSLVLTTLGYY